VTPLHDGMNLVAKEYVAAQNAADPGVLVLSKFAGAANELDAALLVNPHDIDGMAQAIATALAMPLDERRERWDAMMARLRQRTVQRWFSDFTEMLENAEPRLSPSEIPTDVKSSLAPRLPSFGIIARR
jgi:trehalose 6-phosphate synthase